MIARMIEGLDIARRVLLELRSSAVFGSHGCDILVLEHTLVRHLRESGSSFEKLDITKYSVRHQ